MATVRGFEKLDAWQMARKLANEIYDQGYIDPSKFEQLQTLASDVSKKLGGLIAYLKRSGLAGPKYKNSKPETRNPKPESRQAGFSIVTAVFLVVVLALLGAFIVSVGGMQQSTHMSDVQGVRAYQAARAGVEWAAWQVLDPNNDLPGIGGTANLPPCPGASTNLSSLAQSLSVLTVTVTCAATTTTEGNRNVAAYQIVATACNQPSAGSCPNAAPSAGYVERQLQATLSKCKDPSAAGPRFACG